MLIALEAVLRIAVSLGLVGIGAIFLCIAYVNGQIRSVLSGIALFFVTAALLVVLPS